MRAGVLIIALAACGNAGAPVADNDANPTGDAAPNCSVAIQFTPPNPTASPSAKIRATAVVLDGPGAATRSWTLTHNNADWPYMEALPQLEAIEFVAPEAGIYHTELDLPGTSCFPAQVDLNVFSSTANHLDMRVHVTAPGVAPTFDQLEQVSGGGNNSVGIVSINPGVSASGHVQTGTTAIPAYLRFLPAAARDAIVEGFADNGGAYSVKVRNENHDVLVIPTPAVPNVAPKLFQNWTPAQNTLTLDGGTTVSGTVRDPANALLAGASVRATVVVTAGQQTIEVPSTVGTSDAAGAFTLHVSNVAGGTLRFDVTPPATSGLPALKATSATFVLNQPVAIRYNALAIRDLANTTLRRQGNAIPNGKLAVVASLGTTGTIATGGTPVNATGEVRIFATADATGKLPSTKAPALAMSSVVEVTSGDVAVTALDLTTAVPATIDAPPRPSIASAIKTPASAGASGVLVDFIPTGALALAGAPLVHATSGTNGAISAQLASGGHYELRFADPLGRGAATKIPDVTSATVLASYSLGQRLLLEGKLTLAPNATALGGAIVQILCTACTGVERNRPIAEMVTDSDGAFSLAVPDPGTN
jgi:hypothetical protein